MIDDEHDALLVLSAAGGSVAARRRLIDSHGSPVAALAAGPRNWRSHALDEDQIRVLQSPDEAGHARSRAWLGEPGHHLLGWHDPDYPALLLDTTSTSPGASLFSVSTSRTFTWKN